MIIDNQIHLQDADSSPDQELTNAAATAESLQPKGFTLETTQVRNVKINVFLQGLHSLEKSLNSNRSP